MRNPERFIVESLFLSLFFFSFLIRMLERLARLTQACDGSDRPLDYQRLGRRHMVLHHHDEHQ